MEGFESSIRNAIDRSMVAGASVVAIYRTQDGSYARYEKGFGKESIAPGARDMSIDSLLWVFSCTKLLTAISALQLVERGLLTLDGPLSDVLPEYRPPIDVATLSGGEDGQQTLQMTTTDKPLTLRHLLTHTSGLAYEDPERNALTAWRAALPASDIRAPSNAFSPHRQDIAREWHVPLIFPPGAPGRWNYGVGVDWAGRAIERVFATANANNGEEAGQTSTTLGAYMAKHIWGPLGMKSTTFRPLSTPGFGRERLIARSDRVAGTEKLEVGGSSSFWSQVYDHVEPVDDAGGIGIYSTAADYAKVLESLLRDDGKLLSSGSVAELFRPQLGPETAEDPAVQEALGMGQDALALVMDTGLAGGVRDVKWNYGLGGMVAMDAVPGKFGKGVMVWSGLVNSFWWIDREKGTAGFYGSQVLPWADGPTMALYSAFQKGVAKLAVSDHQGS